MSERVTLNTKDGVSLVGDWYPVPEATHFALLLHMRPATKESWQPWAEILQTRGVACLAIDQRGHGESTMNGSLNYETFTDDQSRAKQLDVDAAINWLHQHGASDSMLSIWGASIGANLAIRAAAAHSQIPHVIALSPGILYRGVATDDAITQLSTGQRILLIASDDDPHQSFDSCVRLHALAPERTIFLAKHRLGHGTTMLENDPALFDSLLEHLHL